LLTIAGVWAALRLPSPSIRAGVFPNHGHRPGSTLGARQVVFSITRPLEER